MYTRFSSGMKVDFLHTPHYGFFVKQTKSESANHERTLTSSQSLFGKSSLPRNIFIWGKYIQIDRQNEVRPGINNYSYHQFQW